MKRKPLKMKNAPLYLLLFCVAIVLAQPDDPYADCHTDAECYAACVAQHGERTQLSPDHPDFIDCDL